MVDFTIKGMEADFNANASALDAQANEVRDVFGGEEGYNSFAEWAGNGGLTEAEVEAYNGLEAAGNLSALKIMAEAFKARFEADGNAPRRDITEEAGKGQSTAGGAVPFASEAEQTRAILDPRYRDDPAYRAQVDARIAAT